MLLHLDITLYGYVTSFQKDKCAPPVNAVDSSDEACHVNEHDEVKKRDPNAY
jgi:hypothetical protein